MAQIVIVILRSKSAMLIKLTKEKKPHHRMRTIDKRCSVPYCNRRVLEGNYFLCEIHYYYFREPNELDEYSTGGIISRRLKTL